MKKSVNTALVAVVLFGIAACSGANSQGGGTPPSGPAIGSPKPSFQAGVDKAALKAGKKEALNSMTINGRKVDLVPQGGGKADFNIVESKNPKDANDTVSIMSSGTFLSYSRFAVIDIRGSNLPDGIIYFGIPTPVNKMPTGNNVQYVGRGLHILPDNSIKQTNVTAQINFDAHHGSITVKGKDVAQFTMSGDIKGTSLSSKDESKGESLMARFYGDQAQELSGRYFRANNNSGLFGVVKQ